MRTTSSRLPTSPPSANEWMSPIAAWHRRRAPSSSSSGRSTRSAVTHRTTYRRWMRKGGDPNHNKGVHKTEEAEEPYRSFALAVRAVRAGAGLDGRKEDRRE